MNMTRMRIVLAAVMLLGSVMVGGCGADTSGSDGSDVTTRGGSSAMPPEGDETDPGSPVTVYFFQGEKLVAAGRIAQGAAVARAAVEHLLSGPDTAETGLNVTSEIPGGTELLGISVEDGVATVDLSSAFASGGGSFSMRGRLAQLVFTLTQFDTIGGVRLRLDGAPVDALGGEGVLIQSPQTRDAYEEFAPAVLIESPLLGGRVSSPLTVSGTANTYEAEFVLEITDADGLIIAEQQVMATSGSGTRGEFEATIEWSGGASGAGAVIASVRSAKDGSRVVVSEIPVALE